MSNRSRRREQKRAKKREQKRAKKREVKNTPARPVSKQALPLVPLIVTKTNRLSLYYYALVFTVLMFIILPGFAYYQLSSITPLVQTPSSGIDILSDCGEEVRGLVGLNPAFQYGNVRVNVAIKDAETMLKKCRRFQFILPGNTTNHQYYLPLGHVHDPILGIIPRNPRKPLPNVHRSPYGFDYVTVDLDELPDFVGTIEYVWLGGVQRRSYAECEIALPFYAMKMTNAPEGTKEFSVEMPIRRPYQLKEQSIAFNGRKSVRDADFYHFDITRAASMLNLKFQNERLALWKDRYLTLLLGLLGAGLSLIAAEIVAIARN